MFYCDECRVAKKYPESFHKSVGKCEICGKQRPCNDVPSSQLPREENPDEWMKEISMFDFINFLNLNGYEIKMANPKHVPGQGYSAAPYYSNVDINSALNEFKIKNGL